MRRSLEETAGTRMRSRRTRISRAGLPGGFTVSVTNVPSRPLILAVATSLGSPAIERPLTSVITSSGLIPFSLAGEPSNTPTTRRPRFRSTTVMPTPENSPLVACRKSSFWRGVK